MQSPLYSTGTGANMQEELEFCSPLQIHFVFENYKHANKSQEVAIPSILKPAHPRHVKLCKRRPPEAKSTQSWKGFTAFKSVARVDETSWNSFIGVNGLHCTIILLPWQSLPHCLRLCP